MNDKKKQNFRDFKDIDVKTFKEEEIKDNFPTLFKEISGNDGLNLNSKEIQSQLGETDTEDISLENRPIDLENDNTRSPPIPKDYLQGFNPSAVDFIRRAKNKDEALEVITFLRKRNEITEEESKKLIDQLNEGLESFGEHKHHGYYFDYQKKKHMEEKMKLMKKQPNK